MYTCIYKYIIINMCKHIYTHKQLRVQSCMCTGNMRSEALVKAPRHHAAIPLPDTRQGLLRGRARLHHGV